MKNMESNKKMSQKYVLPIIVIALGVFVITYSSDSSQFLIGSLIGIGGVIMLLIAMLKGSSVSKDNAVRNNFIYIVLGFSIMHALTGYLGYDGGGGNSDLSLLDHLALF